jgi:hypothetical protein
MNPYNEGIDGSTHIQSPEALTAIESLEQHVKAVAERNVAALADPTSEAIRPTYFWVDRNGKHWYGDVESEERNALIQWGHLLGHHQPSAAAQLDPVTVILDTLRRDAYCITTMALGGDPIDCIGRKLSLASVIIQGDGSAMLGKWMERDAFFDKIARDALLTSHLRGQ